MEQGQQYTANPYWHLFGSQTTRESTGLEASVTAEGPRAVLTKFQERNTNCPWGANAYPGVRETRNLPLNPNKLVCLDEALAERDPTRPNFRGFRLLLGLKTDLRGKLNQNQPK
jgi:hypothetical protein